MFDMRKHYILIIFLFIIAIKLMIGYYSSPYDYYPDEFSYLTTGLSMAGYETSTELDYRPPLLPAIYSILFRISTDWRIVKLVVPIFGILGIISLFLLTRKFFGEKIALIASLLLALNWHFWWYSNQMLSDVPVASLMILCTYLFIKGRESGKYYWLSGIVLGLAFLMKYFMIFIIPVFVIYLFYTEKFSWLKNRNIWLAFLLFILILTPWLVYNQLTLGSPFSALQKQMIGNSFDTPVYFQGVSQQGYVWSVITSFGGVFFYPLMFLYQLSVLISLFLICGLYLFLKSWNKNKSLILISILINFLGLLMTPLHDERYNVMLEPFLLIFVSIGIYETRKIRIKNFSIFPVVLVVSLISVSSASPLIIVDKHFRLSAPEFSIPRIVNAYSEEIDTEQILEKVNGTLCTDRDISGFGTYQKISFLAKQKPLLGIKPDCKFYLSDKNNLTLEFVDSTETLYLYKLNG